VDNTDSLTRVKMFEWLQIFKSKLTISRNNGHNIGQL